MCWYLQTNTSTSSQWFMACLFMGGLRAALDCADTSIYIQQLKNCLFSKKGGERVFGFEVCFLSVSAPQVGSAQPCSGTSWLLGGTGTSSWLLHPMPEPNSISTLVTTGACWSRFSAKHQNGMLMN